MKRMTGTMKLIYNDLFEATSIITFEWNFRQEISTNDI